MPRERVGLDKLLRYVGMILCFALGFLAGMGGVAMAATLQQGETPEANYALLFDGLDDDVDLNAGMLGDPASVTVEAWVQIDQTNKVHYLVTNADSDFNDGFSLAIDAEGRLNFVAASSVLLKGIAVGATVLEVGQWYHVAGVYDSQNGAVRVYVNGAEDGSVDYSGGIRYLSSRDLRLGEQHKAFNRVGRNLQGALDEVRIWQVPREPSELSAHMGAELIGDEEGLVGYWPFNEGSGTTTRDASGASNSGRLSSPEWIEATWLVSSEVQVVIDVKPGGSHNVVMVNYGKLPVALLSSASLDAVRDVERASLTFGKTGDEESLDLRFRGRPNCGASDVNADGLSDLVCKFETRLTGLEPGDTEATLKGITASGEALMGSDDVIVRGYRQAHAFERRGKQGARGRE